MQLYEPGVNESKATGEWIALGGLQEPPAFVSFPAVSALREILLGDRTGAKAAPLQAVGNHTSRERANPIEDEDDGEDEDDLPIGYHL